MQLPWISREHHKEVIAAKDALIQSLEAQNAVLAERLAEPVAVSVTLPENFAVLQPAIVRHKKHQDPKSPADHKDAKEVDWANVDPSNNYLMAQLCAQEYGRMVSPIELAEWTQRVRRQIWEAKQQGIRTPEIPVVGTLETKQPPAHIVAMIDQAEKA
jgi:hypothetical protein